jgi:hypothetical protein
LNRPPTGKNAVAIKEYRATIREMLQSTKVLNLDGSLKRPFLHLAIHGMKNYNTKDIEIGTRHGATCSDSIKEWIIKRFRSWSKEFQGGKRIPLVVVDKVFVGNKSKEFHRRGDVISSYPGYGHNFNTVQVELSRWLRKGYRPILIDFLSHLVFSFEEAWDVMQGEQ